jgi:hypothetical protein
MQNLKNITKIYSASKELNLELSVPEMIVLAALQELFITREDPYYSVGYRTICELIEFRTEDLRKVMESLSDKNILRIRSDELARKPNIETLACQIMFGLI